MSQEEIADHRMSLIEVSGRLSLEHDVTVSVMVEPKEQFNRYKYLLPFYKKVLNEGVRYARGMNWKVLLKRGSIRRSASVSFSLRMPFYCRLI